MSLRVTPRPRFAKSSRAASRILCRFRSASFRSRCSVASTSAVYRKADSGYPLSATLPLEMDNVDPLSLTRAETILLLVLGGVVFLDALDLSLVQVALPSIGADLRLPEAQLQWIVSAFVLGYGGLLLFGGRCADVLGRKRVLVWALVALIGASILGAVAT